MIIIGLFDPHLEYGTPHHPSYLLAKEMVKAIKPDILILGGDFLEMGCFSHWNKKKPLLTEGLRWRGDVEMAWREFDDLCMYAPRREFIMGNHEDWLYRYLEMSPELEGFMNFEEMLQLKDYGFGLTLVNQVLTIGKLNFLHGWYHNKYHARKHLEFMGGHTFYGHTHDHQTYVQPVRAKREPHMAMSCGCLTDLDPIFMRNKPTNHVNGFGLWEVRSNGDFNAYFISIFEQQCSYGLQTWELKDDGSLSVGPGF